jgi:outer membrane lipoprotein-sorting protein
MEALAISDGEKLVLFSSVRNEYSTRILSEPTRESSYIDNPLNLPFFGPANQESIGAFVDFLAEASNTHCEVKGSESIVGRQTSLLDCSILGADGGSSGSMRLWVDETIMFVLAQELIDEGGGRRMYTTVELELNPPIQEEVFDFLPPPGATERP